MKNKQFQVMYLTHTQMWQKHKFIEIHIDAIIITLDTHLAFL